MPYRWTQLAINLLDRAGKRGRQGPEHLETGQRGEEAAYFYLQRQGYVIVARNFRAPQRRGEIDLIGWDDGVLAFIEVKTRSAHDMKPAEAAVDKKKRQELTAMARIYLRRLGETPAWRFDVVSVYPTPGETEIELFKNAFPPA